MSKYIKPEIRITEIKTEDIILTSAFTPTTTVGSEDAVNLGSKPVSIFAE